MIKNDRKKLDMDSADPQNRSEWRETSSRKTFLRKTCQKAQPSVEENGLLNRYDDDFRDVRDFDLWP